MLLVLVSFVGWTCLFIVLQKFYKDDLAYTSHVISFTHASIICQCCEIVWYVEQSMKLDQFGSNLTIPQYCVLSLSAGYFLYDTSILCLYCREETFFISHHIISIFTLTSAMITLKSGPEIIFSIWWLEFSGPYLNMRFLLEKSAYKSTYIALINECIFGITFICFRYGFGIWTLYKFYWSPETLFIIKVCSLTFFLINLYITVIICIKARDIALQKFKVKK